MTKIYTNPIYIVKGHKRHRQSKRIYLKQFPNEILGVFTDRKAARDFQGEYPDRFLEPYNIGCPEEYV